VFLVDARKSYARRQNRDLLAAEIEEIERETATLKEAEASDTGLIDNVVWIGLHLVSLRGGITGRIVVALVGTACARLHYPSFRLIAVYWPHCLF
jgi:hypothetical protein